MLVAAGTALNVPFLRDVLEQVPLSMSSRCNGVVILNDIGYLIVNCCETPFFTVHFTV